jgi:hypothetical protein
MPIRARGALLLVVGGAFFSLFAYWIAVPEAYPFDYYPAGPGGALLIGAPGALALIGLIECMTGMPFHQIEAAWAGLSGWQRFVGGTVIVLVGGAAVFAGVAVVLI